MQYRPFLPRRDLQHLIDISVQSFQFAEHPEWNLPHELGQILRPQFRALRWLYPLLWVAGRFDPRLRWVLGGVVAESAAGRVVGLANMLRLYQGPRVEIGNVGVIPSHRRQGIARTMMQHCLIQAEAHGADRAELNVIAGNAPALRLYESMGFVRVGATEEYTCFAIPRCQPAPLPPALSVKNLAFGDGRARASILQGLGRDVSPEDLSLLYFLRLLAPLFFGLAAMAYWGRVVEDPQGQSIAVLSILYQPGTNTATLTLSGRYLHLAPLLLQWLLAEAWRGDRHTPLRLSIEQAGLGEMVQAAGFEGDTRYIRLALPLSK